MKHIAIMALVTFALAISLSACGQLTEDGTGLLFETADPRLNIGFRLLPPPPPLPTITPQVTPCMEIKGNINAQGEKIAHAPGQANYDNVVISSERGEKLFCTMEDAIAAGWRPAQR